MATTIVQDNFTDTASTALESHTPDTPGSGTWTRINEDSATVGAQINASNQCAGQDEASTGTIFYPPADPSDHEQTLKWTFVSWDEAGTDDPFGVIARMTKNNNDAAGAEGYICRFDSSGATPDCQLLRRDGSGGMTGLESVSGVTRANEEFTFTCFDAATGKKLASTTNGTIFDNTTDSTYDGAANANSWGIAYGESCGSAGGLDQSSSWVIDGLDFADESGGGGGGRIMGPLAGLGGLAGHGGLAGQGGGLAG